MHLVLGTWVWCTRLNHDLFLVPGPTSYPSQQYSSSQPSPTPSRRSTLATTPAYDHASLSSHPPAPPPLSGSTSYNPSFPVPAVPVRHPPTNPLGPPPSAPSPILHRATTMPMPVPLNTASSAPYDMRPPNTTRTPSQPGNLGGLQPTQGWSYRTSTAVVFPTVHAYNERLTAEVHERDGDSSNFNDGDLEQSREGTRHSGEYMRERAPPNYSARGRQRERSGLSRREAHF
jgi:hypothetical protein